MEHYLQQMFSEISYLHASKMITETEMKMESLEKYVEFTNNNYSSL